MTNARGLERHAHWLLVLAVTALPAIAADTGRLLTVAEDPAGTSLALDQAAPFHVTDRAVVDPQLVQIPDSPGVVATWQEIESDGGAVNMYAVSLDGRSFARVRETTYYVRLRYANFDPLVAIPDVDETLAAPQDNQLFLVQFIAPPLEQMRDEIQSLGGAILRFMADHTHIVRMSAETRDQVAQLPYVRWVGPFHVAYKVDDEILAANLAGFPESGPARYSIEVFERGPAQQQTVQGLIQLAGAAVHFITPLGFRMEATLTPQQLLTVLGMHEVHVAHPKHFGDPRDMDIARRISGADFIENNTGFTGQGVRGESFDVGFQTNHPDFIPTPIWRTTQGAGSHGTSTYGICFGTGAGNAGARGLNPDNGQGYLSLASATTQFGGSVTRHSLTRRATNPNRTFQMVFQTSSVGSPRTRVYNSISAEVDDYLFRFDLLSFQSMSNANRLPDVRPQAWAKNIIGVGGITHRNTQSRGDDFSSGSSGPAQDGRIKPDLAHFYDSILTTTTGGYTPSFGGTSGATPITAGLSGLFFQMWHEGVFPGHGGGTSVFDSRAKMATAKAMMINSAFKYSLTQGGLGRINQGWGMVSLRKMYNHRDLMFIVDETDLLTPLGVNCYEVEVAAGENELAVTMVYTDPMGPTSSTQHRINDLSLRVTSPSNVVYWGNNGLMTSNLSASGGSSNTKDTVENVFIADPEAGIWTVEVLGDEIIEDSHPETPELDADYALVVAGVVNGGACGGACEPCDMNCDTEINALDIEFFIDLLFSGADPCCGNRGEVGSTGDVNLDGMINALDIEGFISCLFP